MKNYVREERAKLGLTQDQLAGAMKVTREMINSIEKNRFMPSVMLGLRFEMFFNLPASELFALEESEMQFDKVPERKEIARTFGGFKFPWQKKPGNAGNSN